MTAKCKLPLLLLAFISQCMFLFGQQAERYLEIRGHAESEMNPLGNATATLFDGNSRVSSVQTGSDGGFSFKLEANKLYTVEVSKDGMVTKKISFNTAIPDAESGIWVREFAIGLVVPCEGVDYSPLQKPVGHSMQTEPEGVQPPISIKIAFLSKTSLPQTKECEP